MTKEKDTELMQVVKTYNSGIRQIALIQTATGITRERIRGFLGKAKLKGLLTEKQFMQKKTYSYNIQCKNCREPTTFQIPKGLTVETYKAQFLKQKKCQECECTAWTRI